MQLFANNATSKLVAGISNVSLSLQVSAGDGAKFPNPTGGDYFLATLSRVTSGIESNVEIVKVTARATDVFTIIRAQEGTSALVYLEDDFVQLRMTAATATANEAHQNNVSNPHTVTKAQVGLGSADNTADADKPVSTAQATAIGLKIDTAAKDASGGVPGLTLFKLNMRNAANTITSWFTNAATVARTWTLPDKSGTVAMTSDITGINSGTNTGDQTSIVGITGTIAQFNTAVTDADLATLAGTETLTNKTLTSPTLSTEAVTVTTNNLPALHPSLNLDFANGRTVDPRITFTRASTATRVNAKGLIETVASGVPRIDYDPVTLACKGLLIEEARTNLLTYSEQFDNAAWTKGNSTITANALTAPDGTLTADKLVENSSLSYHMLVCNPSVTSGVTYTVSRYFKAGGRSEVFLGFDTINSAFTYQYGRFNLNTGVATTYLGSPVLSMVNCGNGWYRCSVTATATATATASISQQLIGTPGAADGSYTGDGTSGLYIWGAQFEAGAFATSYIPTVASQVTRAADVASMTGTNFTSWYRQDEGAFVAASQKIASQTASTFPFILSATDGTSANEISLLWAASLNKLYGSITVSSSAVADIGTSGLTQTSSNSAALAYKLNDAAISINGAAVSADTSCTVPTVDRLSIGNRNGSGVFSGHIARIAFYPKRLTNVELQALSA